MFKANREQFEKNKHVLDCIIKAIFFCGQQNISLRGHRDDTSSSALNKGNFLALLTLIAESNEILHNHLESCKKNATYTSKTIQNEIITIIGECIRAKTTQCLRDEGAVYSIMADEVTDKTCNQEVLSVCLRFLDVNKPEIREIFLDFLSLERTTGKSIFTALINCLKSHGLDVSHIRGQSYDGAAAMSSSKVGVQGLIKNIQPLALFVHCSSHLLNLSIASSCKIPAIKNMMDSLSAVFVFFDASPKRQRFFEHVLNVKGSESRRKTLKGLCKTRWVERHTCFETFLELYEFVCVTLENLVDPSADPELLGEGDNWSWDKDSRITAQGLLHTIKSGQFLVAFFTTKYLLGIIKPLTLKLQKRDADIYDAYQMVDAIKDKINNVRKNIDASFKEIFDDTENMADVIGGDVSVPRLAGRQRHRANVQTKSPDEHYKINMAIPFVDHLSHELSVRFSDDDRIGSALFCLVPENVKSIQDVDNYVERLLYWEIDLPTPLSLKSEVRAWKAKWVDVTVCPKNLIDSLGYADVELYPNIHKLFVIACTLPVGSTETERSFSALRRIKTYLRNKMGEDRLAGLTLMNLHPNVVDVEEVRKLFIKKNHRRMFSAFM